MSALKSANQILEQKLQANERYETQSYRSGRRSRAAGGWDDLNQSQFNNSMIYTPRSRRYSKGSSGTNIQRREGSVGGGSVYSRGSNTNSIILKVMGNRSTYSGSQRSFISGASINSTILGQRRRKQGLGLGGKIGSGDTRSRSGQSYSGGSVKSGRSGRSRSSRASGVQFIDGDSEMDDSDNQSMQSFTEINKLDKDDKLAKKIFHNTAGGKKRAPTMEIEELDEDKEDDEDFDASYVDSNSGELVINFETVFS